MAVEAPPGKLIRLTRVTCEISWLPTGRGGRPMHHSFIIRMALNGKLVHGRRVRLRTMKVGGALCTTEQWLLEFFDALGAVDPGTAPAAASSPVRKASADADADLILSNAGI